MNWSFWLLAAGLTLDGCRSHHRPAGGGQLWESSAPGWSPSVPSRVTGWSAHSQGCPSCGFRPLLDLLVSGPRAAIGLQRAVKPQKTFPAREPERVDVARTFLDRPARLCARAHLRRGCWFLRTFRFLRSRSFRGRNWRMKFERVAPVTMPTLTAPNIGQSHLRREGCAYCHTQQIRSLAADVRRFGAPTEAWETSMITATLGHSPHRAGFVARVQPSSPRLATHSSLRSPLVVRRFRDASVSWLFDGSPIAHTGSARCACLYRNSRPGSTVVRV